MSPTKFNENEFRKRPKQEIRQEIKLQSAKWLGKVLRVGANTILYSMTDGNQEGVRGTPRSKQDVGRERGRQESRNYQLATKSTRMKNTEINHQLYINKYSRLDPDTQIQWIPFGTS